MSPIESSVFISLSCTWAHPFDFNNIKFKIVLFICFEYLVGRSSIKTSSSAMPLKRAFVHSFGSHIAVR